MHLAVEHVMEKLDISIQGKIRNILNSGKRVK